MPQGTRAASGPMISTLAKNGVRVLMHKALEDYEDYEGLTSSEYPPVELETKIRPWDQDDDDDLQTSPIILPPHAISAEATPEQPPVEPSLFRTMALVLPRRLWEEELGDALEVLHALRKSGAPNWQIRLKIFSTFAWALVNALREVMSAVTGQAREKEK